MLDDSSASVENGDMDFKKGLPRQPLFFDQGLIHMSKSISIPITTPCKEHTGDPNYLPNEVRVTFNDDFVAIADTSSRIDLTKLQAEQLVEELAVWIRNRSDQKKWSDYWTNALK